MERDNRLRVLFPFRQSTYSRLGVVAVFDITVAVFSFAVALFGCIVSSSLRAWYRCSIRLCCGGIPLRPNLLHIWHGIVVVFGFAVAIFGFAVAVFGFAVAVFCFALISSRAVWYHCGIRLRCGGIRLRCGGIRLHPNLFTPIVVSLWYSTSL